MIEFKQGDIFDTKCDTIVCTVNCIGVMGKGIALACKSLYPRMFRDYQAVCNDKIKEGGDIWYWHNSNIYTMPLFIMDGSISDESENMKKCRNILCFATKEDWKNNSKLEWIERGLQKFTELVNMEYKMIPYYEAYHIHSIAFPKLGCENGGLDWNDVKPLMISYLNPLNIKCEIYE